MQTASEENQFVIQLLDPRDTESIPNSPECCDGLSVSTSQRNGCATRGGEIDRIQRIEPNRAAKEPRPDEIALMNATRIVRRRSGVSSVLARKTRGRTFDYSVPLQDPIDRCDRRDVYAEIFQLPSNRLRAAEAMLFNQSMTKSEHHLLDGRLRSIRHRLRPTRSIDRPLRLAATAFPL